MRMARSSLEFSKLVGSYSEHGDDFPAGFMRTFDLAPWTIGSWSQSTLLCQYAYHGKDRDGRDIMAVIGVMAVIGGTA